MNIRRVDGVVGVVLEGLGETLGEDCTDVGF